MAYSYWKNHRHEQEAVFHLFFRKNPFQGHFALNAGLELVVEHIAHFGFSEDDVRYLSQLTTARGEPLFETAFLKYLRQLKFSGNVDAIPEGTVVFPHLPLIKVQAPIIECQLLETALLNLTNFSTLIATKAARICQAAAGDPVLEFGLRRAQGNDGGLTAARSAYIGGCTGTSNVRAGQRFDIPVKGTHAHSWVMSFDTELEAFEAYARVMPGNCIFLVDTYDTLAGVEKAIQVAKQLTGRGYHMLGIRLDSGDLTDLSIKARKMLDKAGLQETSIVASNDLDEHRIKALKEAGAMIDIWGVGTRLVTAKDQPALGGVYKLAAIKNEQGHWQYKLKLSEEAIKTSNPGPQQVSRFYDDQGLPIADCIENEWSACETDSMVNLQGGQKIHLPGKNSGKLLVPVFRNGDLVHNLPDIHSIRKHSIEQQQLFSSIDLSKYPVGLEFGLQTIKQDLINDMNLSSRHLLI